MKFDVYGFIDMENTPKSWEDVINLFEFAQQFGLTDVIHPIKEFDELLMPDSHWFCSPFKDPYLTVAPEIENGPNDRPWFPLKDGRIATFEIDITKNLDDIQRGLLLWVRLFKGARGIGGEKGGNIMAKRLAYYDVWDQRKKRIPFSDIALKNKKHNEPLGKAIERVKQEFYRAFELIMGYKFGPQQFKRLQSEIKKIEVVVPCENCQDEECRNAMEVGIECNPCPAYYGAIGPYIDQDYVKSDALTSFHDDINEEAVWEKLVSCPGNKFQNLNPTVVPVQSHLARSVSILGTPAKGR